MLPRLEHVMPQAMSVHADEKVLALYERNGLTSDYKHLRRWQFIYVNRGDAIAEFITDLGPAEQFDAPELVLWSLWSDSVGQVMEEAERSRAQPNIFRDILAEAQGTSTLTQEFAAFVGEREKQKRNASTFGPGFNRQRNAFVRAV